MNAQLSGWLAVLLTSFWIASRWAAPAAQQAPSPAEIAELRLKAEKGEAQAQYELGYGLLFGWGKSGLQFTPERGLRAGDVGTDLDKAAAFTWLLKAAEQGHSRAQGEVGLCYLDGLGVAKNEGEALRWNRKAAEQGDQLAQMNLSTAFAQGWGVPKDDIAAATWLRHLAEQGFYLAQHYLGRRYVTGEGVPMNHAEAYKWYLLAGAQGFEDARKAIESIERTLSPSDRAEGQQMAREFKPRRGPPIAIQESPPPIPKATSPPGRNPAAEVISSREIDWGLLMFMAVCVLGIALIVSLRRRAVATSGARSGSSLPAPAVPDMPAAPKLYVLLNGNQHGPLTQDQALDMVRQGQLIGETPAWKEGLADWTRLDQIVNLTVAGSTASPLPSQQTKANPAVIQSQMPFTSPQPATGARPGLRFLARLTDLILFSNCIYLVALLAAPRLIPANYNVRAVLFAFLWCFVEAGLLSTWGMTPGKALLKVQVRKSTGSVLSYFDALARAFDVWLRGIGLGAPVISLIALIAGYQRLTTKGTTSWDEKGNYQVTHGTVGPVRLVVAIIVVVLAFVFGVVVLTAGLMLQPRS